MDEKVSIRLSKTLFNRLKKFSDSNNYDSVEDCLEAIVSALLDDDLDDQYLSQEEQNDIESGLRKMRYIK